MRKEKSFKEFSGVDRGNYDAAIEPINTDQPEQAQIAEMDKRGFYAMEFLKTLCDALNESGHPSRIAQDGFDLVFRSPVDCNEIDLNDPEHSLRFILASLQSLDAEFEIYPKFGIRFFEPAELEEEESYG